MAETGLDCRFSSQVVAVSISPGGVPKLPQLWARVDRDGLWGDGRAHAKHAIPTRAVSLFDIEIMRQLVAEGYALQPGSIGENLTVSGLSVQSLPLGATLKIGAEVILRLEASRKPCYVLDVIDPRLKEVIVGRCGVMASVVRGGGVGPGMPIAVAYSIESPSLDASEFSRATASRSLTISPGS